MADNDSTRTTGSAETASALERMSIDLNAFGALLAGVEDICKIEDISGDALNVAASTCRKINGDLCKMADRLSRVAKGGAA